MLKSQTTGNFNSESGLSSDTQSDITSAFSTKNLPIRKKSKNNKRLKIGLKKRFNTEKKSDESSYENDSASSKSSSSSKSSFLLRLFRGD